MVVNGIARIQDSQEDLFEKDDNFLLEMLSEVLEDAVKDRERQAEDGLLIRHALLQKKLAEGLLYHIDELLRVFEDRTRGLNDGKDELKPKDLGSHVDGVKHAILASTKTANVGPRRGVRDLFLAKLANTLKYHECIVKIAFGFIRIVDFLVLFIELVRLHRN